MPLGGLKVSMHKSTAPGGTVTQRSVKVKKLATKPYHTTLYLALSCVHLYLAADIISDHLVSVILAVLYAMLAISATD
jgi:hypothetical protein